MRHWPSAFVVALAFLCSRGATAQIRAEDYRVSFEPTKRRVLVAEPIVLRCRLENLGTETVWFPGDAGMKTAITVELITPSGDTRTLKMTTRDPPKLEQFEAKGVIEELFTVHYRTTVPPVLECSSPGTYMFRSIVSFGDREHGAFYWESDWVEVVVEAPLREVDQRIVALMTTDTPIARGFAIGITACANAEEVEAAMEEVMTQDSVFGPWAALQLGLYRTSWDRDRSLPRAERREFRRREAAAAIPILEIADDPEFPLQAFAVRTLALAHEEVGNRAAAERCKQRLRTEFPAAAASRMLLNRERPDEEP